jgi:hypothetical protein
MKEFVALQSSILSVEVFKDQFFEELKFDFKGRYT